MSNPARAQDSHQLPYQVYEDARQLNDTDMEFIAEYTKVPVDALHDHVLRVWQRAKQEVLYDSGPIYSCILGFAPLSSDCIYTCYHHGRSWYLT